jgi:hypothetical protein
MGAAKKIKGRVREIVEKELEEYFDALENSEAGKTIYNKFDNATDCVLDFGECLVDCMKERGAEKPASRPSEENEDGEKKPGRRFAITYMGPGDQTLETEIMAASQNHALRMFAREYPGRAVETIVEITTTADV